MAEREQMTDIEFVNFLNDSEKHYQGVIDMSAEILFFKECGCKIKMGEYDIGDDEYKCRIKFCKNHEHYDINVTEEFTKHILDKYNVFIMN
jgi:hypothetical protein